MSEIEKEIEKENEQVEVKNPAGFELDEKALEQEPEYQHLLEVEGELGLNF